jgi:DNA primase
MEKVRTMDTGQDRAISKRTVLSSLSIRTYYATELSVKFENGSKQGSALCPFHMDTNPSLSVNLQTGYFKCFGCGKSGSIFDFHALKYGLSSWDALKELAEVAGVTEPQRKEVIATYDYTDEARTLLFQVVRYEPKGFTQRRPDGKGGWIYNLEGVTTVLYNLPDVIKAETIFIVEGEKDVESLRKFDVVATTNPMGAGKWNSRFNRYLAGKDVVVLPDNDEPGRKHAEEVAKSLSGSARTVKIVTLPGLPDKGDVTDWVGKGGTKESLLQLTSETLEWKEAEAPKASMTFTSLADLFREDEENVSWLVDEMLPVGGFSTLAGKPKGGKSTLARNLALCVAQGKDFLGRKVAKGPVLYLALEEKRAEVKKHFRDMGATGDEEVYIFASSAPVDALNQIREKAVELRPALIIIDPLFRFARVKDSNDYAQVSQALEPLLRLARETPRPMF